MRYRVIIGSSCPKLGSSPVRFKSFNPGSIFIGTLDETKKPAVIVDSEGYQILKANVYPDAEMPSTGQGEATMAANGEQGTKLPSDVQSELDKAVKRDFIGDMAELSKGATSGAVVGAIVGIILGLYYQKSILMTGFAGLAIGGLIGRNYHKSKNDNKKEELKKETDDSN